MRRIAARVEALGPVSFVLVIGLVAGAIQGLPRFFLGSSASTGLRPVGVLIVGATAVLWWAGALLLWWIAVRREQSSLWMVAGQVTLGLALADVLATGLGMVVASIETRGEFARAVGQHLSTAVVSILTLTALRSPVWYLASVVTVALGRHLGRGGQTPFRRRAVPASR